jgi:DNA-binding MarR family transcriptional regulator
MKKSDVFSEIEKSKVPVTDYSRVLANLHYTHFLLMQRYNVELAKYNLTTAQSNVLGILGHYAPAKMSLEEIKDLVLEPNSDVSRIVTRLAEKKLVKKAPDEKNKRKVAIQLTSAGNRLYNEILNNKTFIKYVKTVTPEEATIFAKVLGKLRDQSAP